MTQSAKFSSVVSSLRHFPARHVYLSVVSSNASAIIAPM